MLPLERILITVDSDDIEVEQTMASKKPESTETVNPETKMVVRSWDDFCTLAPELAAPEAVNLVDTLDGTWAKEKGAIIVGEISHLYTWEPKKNGYGDESGDENGDEESEGAKMMIGVCLILRAPVLCKTEDGIRPLPAGSKVGVTLAKKLRGIQFQRPGDVIGIQAVRLVPFTSTRSVWEYRVRASTPARPEPMIIPSLPF